MSTTPGGPDDTGEEHRPDPDPTEAPTPPPPEPSTQPLGYWEQQAAHQAQQPPPPPGYPYAPQYPVYQVIDHPKATTALVLGLVGIVGGLTCYVPLVLGPWAWAIGRKAVKEIDAQPQRYGGRGPATAGYVLGIICTVLLVLGVLALAGLLVFAVTTGGGSGPVRGIRA